MQHDRNAQSQSSSDDVFIVGEDISNEPNESQSTLNTEAIDRGNNNQIDVAGDNANIVGDGDAMTAGSTAKPTPDDDAIRRMGRETSHRTVDGERSQNEDMIRPYEE